MSRFYIYFFSLLLMLLSFTAEAQQALEPYGKNRIQYKNFEWRYYSSENFDVYFYDGGEWLARLATDYLEEEFNRVTDILGYAPYFKTKIFLYNSDLDLQQSNVGIDENNFALGGQTEFVKSHVEIAYPGTVEAFKENLLFNISQMLINEMMFGGSLADMFQNQYLLNLPDWFMDGAAAYIARGYDVTLDDFARDFFKEGDIRRLNKYAGDEAVLVGQSIWNFVAENYGRSNISNILNLTRIIRNEEKSIANTLGLPFRQFMAEWYTYYNKMVPEVRENYVLPAEENEIDDTNKREVKVKNIALSPDGAYLAYTMNNQGRFKVEVKNTLSGKSKIAVRGGYKVINQEVDYDMPLLSWADENNLIIITSENGSYFLYTYNASTKDLLKKELGRLQGIESFDISDGGSLAVLSANLDGKNDLFLISLRRNSIKRLTNDIFDDTYPHFVPNTSSIIFSSNRTTDSLRNDINDFSKVTNNFNIFVYNIDTTRQKLSRITNTISTDIYPIPISANEFLFLSDQKGIYNIYKYKISNKLYNQVTNYLYSIKDYDVSDDVDKLAFIMIDDSQNQVYFNDEFNVDNNIFTPQTKRQQIINAKIVTSRLRERQLARQDSLRKAATEDSLVNLQDQEKTPLEIMIERSDNLVDTDNYTFDKDVVKESKPEESFLSAYRRSRRESKIQGPLDYETRFTWNNLTTSFVIDPLLRFGIQLETQMTDLLENHKFNGGVVVTPNLRSGNLFAEYRYLKERIDYGLRYERRIWVLSVDESPADDHKYTFNKIQTTASIPINVSSRVSINPFIASTNFYDLAPRSLTNTNNTNFAGFSAEYTFDNTIVKGLNLIQGTRAKLQYTHYEGLNDKSKSFSNIKLDIRNYQKIYREMVFATRFFYGRFWGNNQPNYLLGGLDNWITTTNPTTKEGTDNPLILTAETDNSDILFAEFLTGLRGFNFNTLYGANAMLFNAELRIPIIKLFHRGPIASNFFRNLQFVGFYDIGSAWTGNSPFATENEINTVPIESGSFFIRVKNYKNPWLSSYGTGVRTMLLGYYVKFDIAWPVEDYVVQDQRYLVSLGFDF